MGVFCRFDSEVELDHICTTDLHNENQIGRKQEQRATPTLQYTHYISHISMTRKSVTTDNKMKNAESLTVSAEYDSTCCE